MIIREGLAIALLALVSASQTVSAVAAESWRMVTTPHFRVLSQAGDRQTQLWIRNYEQFISAVSTGVGIKANALPPLTVILFARDKEFTPYKLMRPDGNIARVSGQFVRLAGISAIGMAADSEQAETKRIVYHEATHWLMSVDPARHPTWFSEGIAEMFSTFEQNGSKMNWAKPIPSHLQRLQRNGLLPLKDFLARSDALKDQERDDDRYYAQSWAFVHFLMLSPPSKMQMLDRILVESRKSSSEAAVSKVFGANLAALENEFNHYVQQAAFSYFTFPSDVTAESPASVAAPPAIVDAALGFMALATGRKELAQQHAQRAVELATELPDGHEVLALLARQNKDEATARKHVEAAIRAGSRSAEMYLMMANSLGRERAGGFQATVAARIPLLQKAIALDPVQRGAYRQLANDLMYYEKPKAEELHVLEQGQSLFADDDWIKVAVATASVRLGGGNDALKAIQTALRPDSSLTSDERRSIGSLRRSLLMQAMDAELKGAQEKNDIAAARAVVARYRQTAGDDKEIADYLQRRDNSFEMSQLVARMNATLGSGRTAELNQLFDQILAHPAVTPQLRNFVETTRKNLKQ
ncbi:MAG: hypothetical protein ABI645_16500 [Pseudomonadota bacterium]